MKTRKEFIAHRLQNRDRVLVRDSPLARNTADSQQNNEDSLGELIHQMRLQRY
ncbi:hypothetical protein L915_05843 [Phytophthora nicotianae]|uniref:Uncharacterized protein n=1 Tax=Phytophthora nicotianae TaxID=4792 RepID=W2H581_PHYNI|nr:hypothetical protein L915_05843 [Phytophthora nicotianae]ETL43809.1 hypothetical protein L916_05775 [Phytophthora nicotianae]